LLAFAADADADAGAFAALGGQDVGVAGVDVTPGEVVLQAASTVWFGWSEALMVRVRNGPNCASDWPTTR
jgi:hypothetical protein